MGNLARIAELKQREKDYKAQLAEWESERKALENELELGLIEEDGLVAQVSERKMFNAAVAEEQLSPELFRGICVMKPDSKMAKEVLTGAEYRLCQKVTGRVISFKKG